MRSFVKFVLIIGIVLLMLDTLTLNTASARVIRVKRKNDVTKREAKPDAKISANTEPKFLFDAGELVAKKPKPKKRLALPVNYVLKAAAENEDVYDKVDAENGEEDFEKKEWSDVARSANDAVKDENEQTEQTTIKEVEIAPIVQEAKEETADTASEDEIEEQKQTEDNKQNDTTENKTEEPKETTTQSPESAEEEDDEEERLKAEREEIEKAKAKEKKERILNEVDELKKIHVERQRLLSEKHKEEDRLEEEAFLGEKQYDKYDNKREGNRAYEDYEENPLTVRDKYPINTSPKSRSTTKNVPKTTRNLVVEQRMKKRKPKKKVLEKVPLFRNPRLYIDNTIEDASDDISTTSLPKSNVNGQEENVRISLVPEDGNLNDNEPAAFQIKKRKLKRRRKQPRRKTTPAPDTSVAETIEEKSSAKAATVRVDAVSTSSDAVADAVPASTEHKKGETGGDYTRKTGGIREHKHDEHSEHGEHGKKAYEAHHENTKAAKGHHDKEDHSGEYKDHGGHDKSHHSEGHHYGAHHHEENGKKHAKYEESGQHSKGHSTKGTHNVHKKDEFEKKIEFFEEDGDSDEDEMHGGFQEEKKHSSGGHFKKGKFDGAHTLHAKGDSGHFAKGGHGHSEKGHKSSAGHDSHGKGGGDSHHKGHKRSGKRWMYHHGTPAKTAHLIPIDRQDRYIHGPLYYG